MTATTRPRPQPGSAEARMAAQRRTRIWLAALAAVVLAIAVAVAISATTGGDEGDSLTVADAVTVSAPALPAQPAEGADPAVGLPAPVLSGIGFDGAPVTIAADGSPVLIAVFAHWCPHCQRELPILVDHLAGGGLAGIDVYGVSTAVDARRGNYPPGAWFQREGFDRPVLLDTAAGDASAALAVDGFPTWVLVNGDGRVAARTSGELTVEQMDAFAALAE